ncbi:hypothetical protein ACLB1M_20875 [Escherichia coli]
MVHPGRILNLDRSFSRVRIPAKDGRHRYLFHADIDIATKAISSKRWCIRQQITRLAPASSPSLKQRSSLVPAVNSATSSAPLLLKISENMVHPAGFSNSHRWL